MVSLAFSLLASALLVTTVQPVLPNSGLGSSVTKTTRDADGRIVTNVTITSFRPGSVHYGSKLEAIDAGLKLGAAQQTCQSRHCAFVVYEASLGFILSNVVEGDLDEFEGVEAALGESVGAFVQLFPPAGRYIRGLPAKTWPDDTGRLAEAEKLGGPATRKTRR